MNKRFGALYNMSYIIDSLDSALLSLEAILRAEQNVGFTEEYRNKNTVFGFTRELKGISFESVPADVLNICVSYVHQERALKIIRKCNGTVSLSIISNNIYRKNHYEVSRKAAAILWKLTGNEC